MPTAEQRRAPTIAAVAVAIVAAVAGGGCLWWVMRGSATPASPIAAAIAIAPPGTNAPRPATVIAPKASPAAIEAPPKPAAATLDNDPVAHFKRFAAGYVSFGQELSRQPKPDRKEVWTWKADEGYSINVMKTDSLVTPYLATIISKVSYRNDVDHLSVNDADVEITFAGQEGRWAYKSTAATYVFADHRFDCSDIMGTWLRFLSERLPPSAIDVAAER